MVPSNAYLLYAQVAHKEVCACAQADVLAGMIGCSRNMKIDASQFTMVGDEAYVREGALYLCTAARKLPAC